jgi:hypothetical protein
MTQQRNDQEDRVDLAQIEIAKHFVELGIVNEELLTREVSSTPLTPTQSMATTRTPPTH